MQFSFTLTRQYFTLLKQNMTKGYHKLNYISLSQEVHNKSLKWGRFNFKSLFLLSQNQCHLLKKQQGLDG